MNFNEIFSLILLSPIVLIGVFLMRKIVGSPRAIVETRSQQRQDIRGNYFAQIIKQKPVSQVKPQTIEEVGIIKYLQDEK